VKVPLADQVEHAEWHRDALDGLAAEGVTMTEGPDLQHRLHCQEATFLTLRFVQAHEQPMRAA
jgi:hypothetical protein